MPVLRFTDLGSYDCFDDDERRQAGNGLNARYEPAQPFPQAAVDDIPDPDVLRQVVAAFPDGSGPGA